MSNWLNDAKTEGNKMMALINESFESLQTGDWQKCVSSEREMASLLAEVQSAKDVPDILRKSQSLLKQKALLTESAMSSMAAAALSDDPAEKSQLVSDATATIKQITQITNEMTEEAANLPLGQQ